MRNPKASPPGVLACGSRSWAVDGQEGEPSGRGSALDLGMAPTKFSGMNRGCDVRSLPCRRHLCGPGGPGGLREGHGCPDPGQEDGLTSVCLPLAPGAPEFATPDSDPPERGRDLKARMTVLASWCQGHACLWSTSLVQAMTDRTRAGQLSLLWMGHVALTHPPEAGHTQGNPGEEGRRP